ACGTRRPPRRSSPFGRAKAAPKRWRTAPTANSSRPATPAGGWSCGTARLAGRNGRSRRTPPRGRGGRTGPKRRGPRARGSAAGACSEGGAKGGDGSRGEGVCAPAGLTALVYGLSFSPDGRRLAGASRDGTARVWDAADGRPVHTLKHPGVVFEARYSPDGKL